MSDASDPVLVSGEPGPVLFRLVRLLSRQPGGRPSAARRGDATAQRMSSIQIVQAVDARLSVRQAEVSIGDVARYLRIEHSTASRLIGDTLQAGFVESLPSELDARRTVLRLTAAGRRLLRDSRAYQRTVFGDATADWPDEEREQFGRLLVKFARSILESDAVAAAERS